MERIKEGSMKDSSIQEKINTISGCVEVINDLMAELYAQGVEIRIAYKDAVTGSKSGIPYLDLWRAVEHVDYLQNEEQIEDQGTE